MLRVAEIYYVLVGLHVVLVALHGYGSLISHRIAIVPFSHFLFSHRRSQAGQAGSKAKKLVIWYAVATYVVRNFLCDVSCHIRNNSYSYLSRPRDRPRHCVQLDLLRSRSVPFVLYSTT